MPPWTLKELEMARPYAAVPVPSETLEERFMAWGGNVRYCLSSAAILGRVQLAAAIQRLNVESLLKLLDRVDLSPVGYILVLRKGHCITSKQACTSSVTHTQQLVLLISHLSYAVV